MVLDEPTAHLDTATATAVTRDVLAALTGHSIVWITHEQVGLGAMDRVVVLQAGTKASPSITGTTPLTSSSAATSTSAP